MDLKLRDRKALVTGSTTGIGYAIAATLAREGAHAFINGRTEDRVSEAVRRIADEVANAKVEGMAADLGTAEGASRLIAEVSEVDILVNNVGIFEPKPFEEIPNADWLRFFEVNVMSGLRLSRHHLPLMKQKSLRTTEKSQLSSARNFTG